MFQVNDIVVYGIQGVCEIVDIDIQRVNGANKSYFVLKPKNGGTSIFYVPTWNEKALSKMRKVITKTDVDTLIDSLRDSTPAWIENENERKEVYRKVLASDDQLSIISMAKALFLQKQERETNGKRLHMIDEHFLKEAEQLLYDEWQYVLNLDRSGLLDYIKARIEGRS